MVPIPSIFVDGRSGTQCLHIRSAVYIAHGVSALPRSLTFVAKSLIGHPEGCDAKVRRIEYPDEGSGGGDRSGTTEFSRTAATAPGAAEMPARVAEPGDPIGIDVEKQERAVERHDRQVQTAEHLLGRGLQRPDDVESVEPELLEGVRLVHCFAGASAAD
jgi:hypothetical protein